MGAGTWEGGRCFLIEERFVYCTRTVCYPTFIVVVEREASLLGQCLHSHLERTLVGVVAGNEPCVVCLLLFVALRGGFCGRLKTFFFENLVVLSCI